MGTLDLSRDSEKGNGCTWCWREVGWCVCVHTRVHMLARIRLRARVCSVLREHMCTVLCTHVCSVRYVNMCVFMHPCVQVCVGGHVCVCSHRHCQYVCVHTLTHTRVSICMFVWLACTRVHAGVQRIRYLCALCLCMRVCEHVHVYTGMYLNSLCTHVLTCVCV